jgi:hypothetical protein
MGVSVSLGLVLATGCARQPAPVDEISARNLVSLAHSGAGVDQTIGDEESRYRVIGETAADQAMKSGQLAAVETARAQAYLSRLAEGQVDASAEAQAPVFEQAQQRAGLLFSMPSAMLNKPMVFGGVITAVSNRTDEELGRLKLSELPPLNVMPTLTRTQAGGFALALLECARDCSRVNPSRPLITFPVRAADEAGGQVVVDLTPLGQALTVDVIAGKDNPTLAKFRPVSSQTVTFDFSQSTLVFDVATRLEAAAPGTAAQSVGVTSRWYLKPATVFNPAFVSRRPVQGVGFFETARGPAKLIRRFDLRRGTPVKYFVKNVPPQFQRAFAGAFDEWNAKFRQLFGQPVFAYEFVNSPDPRAALLVAGDVRFNVIEWDMANIAPYGGLGPSIANEFTGENFNANVLVQGPKIVELYRKWFTIGERADQLRRRGRDAEADELELSMRREQDGAAAPARIAIGLGAERAMDVRAADPQLEDPLAQRDDFERLPAGLTFETYMPGYFHDLVAHELGHNLGLRHNFRGNLGAAEGEPRFAQVSRSIMDYLGRRFRHLDRISEYDVMAISYGYGGRMPSHSNWFCTDEDQTDSADLTKSAECSKDDATADPFGYWEGQLDRAISLLVARGQAAPPSWRPDDMKKELDAIFLGFGSYAGSAARHGQSWTNFFVGGDRPSNPAAVRAFVHAKLMAATCSQDLVAEISAKPVAAQGRARENLRALRIAMAGALAAVFQARDLACNLGI